MDIRNWPLDRIMQLPDCCFGRRWLVITSRRVLPAGTDEWLVKQGLPDRIVLWSITHWVYAKAMLGYWVKFALGDDDPAGAAEFDAFERLFPGDLNNETEEGAMFVAHALGVRVSCMMPLALNGRRFAVQLNNPDVAVDALLTVVFEVSSIPTEVPDWLCSGHLRSP